MTITVDLLLDVDGVFNLPPISRERLPPHDQGQKATRLHPSSTVTACPSPRSVAFLGVIWRTPWLHPYWLTAWGDRAPLWNLYANTPTPFPVLNRIIPPRGRDLLYVPDLQREYDWDWKVGAARSLFRTYRGSRNRRMVWIEDGFSQECRNWAQDAGERLFLVDTTPAWMLTMQGYERERHGHPALSQAAYDLLYCWQEETDTERQEAAQRFIALLREVTQ